MGGGAIAFDYNNDDFQDIYILDSEGPNALYRNNDDGTFTFFFGYMNRNHEEIVDLLVGIFDHCAFRHARTLAPDSGKMCLAAPCRSMDHEHRSWPVGPFVNPRRRILITGGYKEVFTAIGCAVL